MRPKKVRLFLHSLRIEKCSRLGRSALVLLGEQHLLHLLHVPDLLRLNEVLKLLVKLPFGFLLLICQVVLVLLPRFL